MKQDHNNIYKILNDVFKPHLNEQDDEPTDDSELDQEIDGDDLGDDDLGDDLGGDDLVADDLGGDDLGGDDLGGGDFGGGMEDEEDEEEPEEEPDEQEPIGPQADSDDSLSDEEKVNELFSDTDDPSFDYGTGTEPNLRLSRFKFTNAGIEPEMYMDEDEMFIGVPSNIIEDRLSPEQKELYINSNKELRDAYPKIAEREKNILIYNSGAKLVTYDLDNNEQPIEDKQLLKQAYNRLDEYLSKRFGVNWQDKSEAVEVLRDIKVNFDDRQKIQPNLISSDNFTPFEETEMSKIPFNKISIDTPSYVGEFIRSHIQNPEFIKSSIFNSLSSPYTTGEGKSDSPYAIIKGQIEDEPDFEEDPMDDELSDEEPDLEDETEEGEVDEIEF